MKGNLAVALRYYRSLPAPTLAGYLVGVFLIFAALGFIADIRLAPLLRPLDVPGMVATGIANGLIAVLFALGPMRSYRLFFPIAFAFVLLGMVGLDRMWRARAPAWAPADMNVALHRVVVDGWCASALIVMGFIVLVLFIRTEGVRQTRLRTEMDLARDIHAALVPPVALTSAGCEVRGRSTPSSEVGGDLVDAFEHEGRLVACVADVTGHGVPAGTLMAMTRSALRLEFASSKTLADVLANLNRLLVEIGRHDRFVTLACLRIDGAGAAEFALAGHPPILRIRADAGAVERLENASLPLGVQAGASFTGGRIALAPGDLLAIFTDGLTEVRDAAQQEFGAERLERLLVEHRARPLAEIEAAVFASTARHGAQFDDQTLLLVRRS
jgi:hypothetical protein